MNQNAVGTLLRSTAFRISGPAARMWPDFSRLILVGDRGGWVLDEEIRDLRTTCKGIGIRTVSGGWEPVACRQGVFYASQFILLNPPTDRGHRMCFAYFHGLPGSGLPEFDSVFENLRRTRDRWSRIQVSHSEMRDTLLSNGIAPDKVRLIPIAIRLGMFSVAGPESRAAVRSKLGISGSAFVVGSFQKDGNGWGEGLEPKLIKGPDVLLETLRELKRRIPELFVLLSGPARGYVKRGLSAAGIPFRHLFTRRYAEIPPLYHALDVCLVTSRQEGGPKAVLESMASGIPLVTTRVGQAMDLVRDGENGFMVPVDDVGGLVRSVEKVQSMDDGARLTLLAAGRTTAESNSWFSQRPLWKDFFAGIVE